MEQLVLVLDVCKTVHAHTKIRKSCHSNASQLPATSTTVNSVKM